MKPNIKRPGNPLSPERLAEFEQEHNFRFPESYRDFLLQSNGGYPQPRTFCYKGKKTPSEVCNGFYGISTGDKDRDLDGIFETYCDEEERRVPKRLLPIAWDAFGNMICLSLRGNDTGKVYFWDHENEDLEPNSSGDVSDDNVSLIADSFNAFLEQFVESSEEKAAKKKRKNWYQAIANGEIEFLRQWLDSGGNVEEQDGNYATPIMVAINESQIDVAELLLDRGASMDMALLHAVSAQEWTLVASILGRSRKRNIRFEGIREHKTLFQMTLDFCHEPSVIGLWLDLGALLDTKLQRGNALYHATEDVQNPDVVRLLLDRGAKPGVWGYQGRLPLTNAIYAENLEVAKLLMDAGENLYFQPPLTPPSWAKAMGPDYKVPRDFKPVEILDVSKNTKAIKPAILAYAAQLGQTPEFDGPLNSHRK